MKDACAQLYPACRRPDLQSVVRWMCKRLKNPDRRSRRQLVKTVRYVQGSTEVEKFMSRDGALDKIEGYFDGSWRIVDFDRTSVSGGHLLAGGCRLHSDSRTTNQHAFSSGALSLLPRHVLC